MPSREKKNTRGLFVTFEGIEGSGKSSQLRRAADLLTLRNVPVLSTREPGGTMLGTKVRALLLDFSGAVDPGAELLLMFADRRQHLVEEIEPALKRGVVVLCDRYTDASRAYQGAGRRLGEETVDDLHRRFCKREPDRTYLFDCPVPIALARLARRGDGSRDRIEREDTAFHRRVRAAYRLRAAAEPKRFRVLDATRSEEAVFAEVERDLISLLARREKRR